MHRANEEISNYIYADIVEPKYARILKSSVILTLTIDSPNLGRVQVENLFVITFITMGAQNIWNSVD